jgi:hypothetical protein
MSITVDAVGYCLLRQLAEARDDYVSYKAGARGTSILFYRRYDSAAEEVECNRRESVYDDLAAQLADHIRLIPPQGIVFAEWVEDYQIADELAFAYRTGHITCPEIQS